VHVPADADPLAWARSVPPVAAKLIQRHWPGPLTLVLSRAAGVLDAVTGGQDTVGLRCPAHDSAQVLLKAYCETRPDAGVAAPSANRFGHVSPTTAAHVRAEFGEELLIIDGGACLLGIESTILDLSDFERRGPRLLRPGSITALQLAETIGAIPGPADANAPRASGMLDQHYAPRTRLRLVDAAAAADAPDDVALWCWSGRYRRWPPAPGEPVRYAHELYASLRHLDELAMREIWVERPPDGVGWVAIHDRLRRAAAGGSADEDAT